MSFKIGDVCEIVNGKRRERAEAKRQIAQEAAVERAEAAIFPWLVRG